jgi:type VI secretion system secreted protein Hcp
MAQADVHLKLGDIKGESTDDKHKDEINILSWSWGVTNAGSMDYGGGGGKGKAAFSDFHFMHHIDKASSNLYKLCATGEHIKEATLTCTKSGKTPQDYLVLKLSDVLVTSVNDSGGGGPETAESFSLQCAKVEMEYKPQKADGSLDAGIKFGYDIKANKAS